MSARRKAHGVGRLVLAVVVVAVEGLLDVPRATATPRERTVTVGPAYAAGAFRRAMLGSSYRALWTTPIRLEELDLASEAGGLTPLTRVGGQQTKGLALRGRDGRSYSFRGVDKDPSNILPEELQDTFVEDLIHDQMAAQHPAGPLVADELARAAGIPTVPVRLVVMPDDPALGEFRADFAGTAGTFAEYPTAAADGRPGFEGALEIVDHLTLYAKLAESPDDRVDTKEFLRARLFDLFVSDFDRHRKQWRWARRDGGGVWHPIPEDRDQAFARYEGLIVRAAAGFVPQIRTFGESYDRIHGLTYNGREQDRWLLAGLAREDWRAAAEELRARITDDVIERAARRLPPEWYALDGARLAAALRRRRDTLDRAADRFYRHLAGQVDVQATNAAEEARVRRFTDGAVEVSVAQLGTDGAPETPYFHRRFVPGETSEVRLYMRGGSDRLLVEGPPTPIRVRAIGGAGDDSLDDSRAGGTRYYDAEGANRVTEGPGTSWDRRPYVPPPGPKAAPWIPPRDWGRDFFLLPWLSYGSDIGLFAGGGFTTLGYGFRQDPVANEHTFRAGWAFGAAQPRIDYRGELHRSNSRAYLGVSSSFSGLEVQRFYGFGNETTADADDDFYKVRQKQLVVAPSVTLPVGGRLDFTIAPVLQHATTQEGDRLIDQEKPYGSGTFGQVGAWARLRLDTRAALRTATAGRAGLPGIFGAAGYPVSGAFVEAIGAVFPEAWSVESTYGWVEGRASTYLTAGSRGRATLALRVGGKHMLGTYPFHNAASVGGGDFFSGADAVRGFRPNRFIGDSSLYGNADLRLYVSRFFLALPGEWGLFGFGDAGRVWLEGESSDTWHTSWGGGIWIGLLARANAVAFTVARTDERTSVYVRAGFSF